MNVVGFDKMLLLGLAKSKEGGDTALDCQLLAGADLPVFRCDLLNMTRHVHHHYEYLKDGHTRTYTMFVQENVTATSDLSTFKGGALLKYHVSFYHFFCYFQVKYILYFLYDFQASVEGVSLNNGIEELLLPVGVHPNRNKAVSVNLMRDKDNLRIPYISIYGVTLISVIRLGLGT